MASSRDVPGGPRRRTPSHPPYALMIGKALRSLAEEGGSSQESISGYIVANYDNLPWGHDKLLPYYLQKLTEQGEFVTVAPGSYSIAGGNKEPGSGFAATEGNDGVPRTPEPERNPVDVGVAEATSSQQNAEAGSPSGSKRCGRPPKLSARRRIDGEGGRGGTGSTPSPSPERDHADARVAEATVQQNAEAGTPSSSKRRGRPPKLSVRTTDGEGDRGGMELEPSSDPERDHADVRVAEATIQQNSEAGNPSAFKRRGRPPKLSARRTDGEAGTGSTPWPESERDHVDVRVAEATTQQNAEAGAPLASKRRGRPPKLSAIRMTDGEGGTGSTPWSEPKRDHVDVRVAVATTQQNAAEVGTPSASKRRGRPPKLSATRRTDGEGGRDGTGSTSLPEPERDHLCMGVAEVTIQQNTDAGTHTASKRRGRPPKMNKLSARRGTDGEGGPGGTGSTLLPEPERDHADVRVAEATTQQNADAGTHSASKRRGRPPKLSARRGTDGEGGRVGTQSTLVTGTRGDEDVSLVRFGPLPTPEKWDGGGLS